MASRLRKFGITATGLAVGGAVATWILHQNEDRFNVNK